MTQEVFFGSIESNLRQLVESRSSLPEYNLPSLLRGEGHARLIRGMLKIKGFENLTKRDRLIPPNIRVYDLISSKLPIIGQQRFRVFAAYSEVATEESYRYVKYHIRKWYQESGWADALSNNPYCGAIVVGSGRKWTENMRPNADDLPFEHVAFHLLAAPHKCEELGMTAITHGDAEDGALIFRALLPETFERRSERVVNYVQRLFRQRSGTVTVERVASATGVSQEDVSNIFNDMQADGCAILKKKNPKHQVGPITNAECMYVEPGCAPIWKRAVSRNHGKWYKQKGSCCLLSVGTFGYIMLLSTKLLENILPDQIMQHRWLLYTVGGILGLGCVALFIRGFFKRS